MPTIICIVAPFLIIVALNLPFIESFLSIFAIRESCSTFLRGLCSIFTLEFLLVRIPIALLEFSLSFLPFLFVTSTFLEGLGLRILMSLRVDFGLMG